MICYGTHVVTHLFKTNCQSNVASSQGRDLYMLVSKWQKQTTHSLPIKNTIYNKQYSTLK